MFGWVESLVDRLAAGLFRRGQALAETEDRALEERRTAVRSVRDALAQAMTDAQTDRDNGNSAARQDANTSADRAGAIVREVDDDEARRLVLAWKALFDAIPKGNKSGVTLDMLGGAHQFRPGYPEPAWSELRAAADAAHDQLGVVLRELLDRRK